MLIYSNMTTADMYKIMLASFMDMAFILVLTGKLGWEHSVRAFLYIISGQMIIILLLKVKY